MTPAAAAAAAAATADAATADAAAAAAAAAEAVDEDKFVGSIMSMGSVGLRGLVSASNDATLKLLKRELDLCICWWC